MALEGLTQMGRKWFAIGLEQKDHLAKNIADYRFELLQIFRI